MKSYDIFRGQAPLGLGVGEGPGTYAVHGEQYLKVDPLFFDSDTLDSLRTKLTLDANDSLHKDLGSQLEGWRCFTQRIHGREYTAVVRLSTNPLFLQRDARAAYFAHARFFEEDTYPWNHQKEVLFHPGSLVGHSEAFDTPWLDPKNAQSRTIEPVSAVPSCIKRDEPSEEQASRLLAWSAEAHQNGRPLLLIPSSYESLRAGSVLHGMVGYMRTALPKHLRRRAFLDITTNDPGYMAVKHGATLIVPTETQRYIDIGDFYTVCNHARLTPLVIDEHGNEQREGREPEEQFKEYGRRVTLRAVRMPEGLLPFTELINTQWPRHAERIGKIYNLAFARKRPEAEKQVRASMTEEEYRAIIAEFPNAALGVDRVEQLNEYTRR